MFFFQMFVKKNCWGSWLMPGESDVRRGAHKSRWICIEIPVGFSVRNATVRSWETKFEFSSLVSFFLMFWSMLSWYLITNMLYILEPMLSKTRSFSGLSCLDQLLRLGFSDRMEADAQCKQAYQQAATFQQGINHFIYNEWISIFRCLKQFLAASSV